MAVSEPNQPDVDKVLAQLGIPKSAYDEPTMTDRLESMRVAIGFVRACDNNDTAGMFRLYETLTAFEVGTVIGALSQLALVGCSAMAALNGGLTLDGQLEKMLAEIESAVQDGSE